MLCPHCGGINDEKLQFCRTCGTALPTQSLSPAPPAPLPGNMQSTILTLGCVWLLFALWSAFGLIRILLLYKQHMVQLSSFSLGFLFPIIQNTIGVLLKLLVAYALLSCRSWGRVAAIVIAIFQLLLVALGQAWIFLLSRSHYHFYSALLILTLGVAVAIYLYTLIALAPARSGAAYRAVVASKKQPQPKPQS